VDEKIKSRLRDAGTVTVLLKYHQYVAEILYGPLYSLQDPLSYMGPLGFLGLMGMGN
jgi:hypothetical protein